MGMAKRELAGIVSTIPVSDSFTVAEVDAGVDLDHGDIGQLRVILRSPAGTEVTLHDHTGAGTAGLHTTYDDLTAPDGPGTMQDFEGESSSGEWTLRVQDDVAGKIPPGVLEGWTLHLRAETPFRCNPLACGEPVPTPVGSTLLVEKNGAEDVVLSWQAVSGAADYHLWRDSVPQFTDGIFAGETGGATTITDAGAQTDPAPRYYLVRSVNSCNWEE
jgi:subtilisin-like proprotein convertase family protein